MAKNAAVGSESGVLSEKFANEEEIPLGFLLCLNRHRVDEGWEGKFRKLVIKCSFVLEAGGCGGLGPTEFNKIGLVVFGHWSRNAFLSDLELAIAYLKPKGSNKSDCFVLVGR